MGAGTMPLLGESTDSTELYSFLKAFDLSHPWAQRNLAAFCKNIPSRLRITRSWCWMADFKKEMQGMGVRFPVLPRRFNQLSVLYRRSSRKATRGDKYLWVEGNTIRAFFFSFESDIWSKGEVEKTLQHKADWNAYVEDWNDNAVVTAQGAFHVSNTWASAESAGALMTSTLSTLLILIGLAFMGMLLFTWSFTLSLYTVGATMGVVFGLAFFITVLMGWSVGLIEVIAAIYFIGYAVTYSLHVAHKYASFDASSVGADVRMPEGLCDLDDEATALRYRRTDFALKAIGGAAMGSAITTAGTSFFLVFCTLRIFTKLGAMCLAVTVMSIITALGPLPAALMVCGPKNPGQLPCKKRRRAAYGGYLGGWIPFGKGGVLPSE